MDYKMGWEDQKRWLNKSIKYLEEALVKASGEEEVRLRGKLDGLKNSLDFMVAFETMQKDVIDESVQ